MKGLFRTALMPENGGSIDHSKKVLMMGSCFSEHIGKKLIDRKFNAVLNPFGILYHPLAILAAITRLIENNPFTMHDLSLAEDRYISFYHHGKFNHSEPLIMLKGINESFEKGREQLLKADYLFITWGTAFGYSHVENKNQIVGNCHKIPAKQFKKELTMPKTIVAPYLEMFKQIKQCNPKIKIVLTVSPVKHLKDGLVDNNLSKSVLLLAAHQLIDEVENASYFPAYELITDDLRDYRFFAKDMAHPSEDAIEYVWDYFKDSFWNDSTKSLNKRIESVLNAMLHRPLHPENKAHLVFIESMKSKIAELEAEFPFLDFEMEKKNSI